MGLKSERKQAHRKKNRKERHIERKRDLRHQINIRLAAAEQRIKEREAKRREAKAAGRDERVDELTRFIQDDRNEVRNLREQRDRINSKVESLKESVARLEGRIRRLTRRIRRRLRRRRRKANQPCTSAGDPCYGGGRDIFEDEVTPAAGVEPHSTKRTETYGNPGSDHHVSQILAFAGDYPPSVERAVAIARELGVAYRGYADDYKLYYIERYGYTFRVQIIAANHGTGPHVHTGTERI